MHDILADGNKIRLLTIVDCCSRESLALEVGVGFKSTEVIAVLQGVCGERGRPKFIRCDNELRGPCQARARMLKQAGGFRSLLYSGLQRQLRRQGALPW